MSLCGYKLLADKAVNQSPQESKIDFINHHDLSKDQIIHDILVLFWNDPL